MALNLNKFNYWEKHYWKHLSQKLNYKDKKYRRTNSNTTNYFNKDTILSGKIICANFIEFVYLYWYLFNYLPDIINTD